jgi:hypothetical protein
MKKIFLKLALCVGLFTPIVTSASEVWKEVNPDRAPKQLQLFQPEKYRVLVLDEATLRIQFENLSTIPEQGTVISLPMPDGSRRDFIVWETPMMPKELAELTPDIRTYTATAADDPTVTAKLDFTLYGFHAMVFDGDEIAFIDPYDNFHDGFYMSYYKKDVSRPESARMKCLLHNGDESGPAGESMAMQGSGLPKLAHKTINGYNLRTYRLALSCSNQYAKAATGLTTPTKAQVLSKMTTSMNRINGVYERELSITMTFTANQNAVIFITSVGDPFHAINSDGPSLLDENQIQCDALIGAVNYDIGHVLTTASGGIASLGSVCSFSKAQGTTGSPSSVVGDPFDIDFVAHEMGHQFGSNHTFNANSGSCSGNGEASMAFEPGSGSTIMAYAGICGADNVQANSDPYFHRASVEKIIAYVNAGGNCAVTSPTGNKLVSFGSFVTAYSIPYLTPFELTAPVATDSMGDSVKLYAWEQADLGAFRSSFAATTSVGPIFRSFNPSKSNIRVFPKISLVMAGNLNSQFEKAPTVARQMKFKCIYRNIRNNKGSVTIPDDIVTVTAVTTGTGAGFRVTSQDMAGNVYTGGSTQTITWDVVNTTAAPVNAANVDIYMSENTGGSWQYYIATVPNTGSATVTLPNPAVSSSACRFKVKGANNVFFNVNRVNFTVNNNPSLPVTPGSASMLAAAVNKVNVFPVPAENMLHITASRSSDAVVYNTLGQMVWQGAVSGKADIDVSSWARGVYHIRLTDSENGTQVVKQIAVQ